jgi:hypothetical protein
MPRSGAKVVGVELVDGTDLSRGRGRRMEHGHDGKRESGWWHTARAGACGTDKDGVRLGGEACSVLNE